MPKFYETSFGRLKTCHIDLVRLFSEVVKHFDCTVLEGSRGAVVQMGHYHSEPRKTKLVYPLSKHNPNEIDIPGIARILSCQQTLEAIKQSIVVATPRQLVKIDKLDPLEKSLAIDVIPWPVDWRFEGKAYVAAIKSVTVDPCDEIGEEERKRLVKKYVAEYYSITHNIERWFGFIFFVKATAIQMGIKIRCGADWDGDNCMADQKWVDMQHVELVL